MIRDIIALVGLVLLAIGAGQVYAPLAPLVVGAALLWVALRLPRSAGSAAGAVTPGAPEGNSEAVHRSRLIQPPDRWPNPERSEP